MSVSVSNLILSVASSDDAAGMVQVIHAAFGARPKLDPPSTAILETPATIAAAVSAGGGIFATADGHPAGALVISDCGGGLAIFQRVSVHPAYQRHGVASAMVAAAQDFAAELGFERVEVFARSEFEQLITFWQHRGFTVDRPEEHGVILAKKLPVVIEVPTGDAMRALGERLAPILEPGDLIIASGELGAGKTTLTQGIGRGLGSEGAIISPTFVLSRVHKSVDDRPDLVHVDAYRLGSAVEVEDLDLDSGMAGSVTVVEWGEGLAESLAHHRLEIDIRRQTSDDTDTRTVLLRPVGSRWDGVDLSFLRDAAQ
ncbi:MAG TPA: tRNA (adenosine(37)-N6)-threonylcarbamoyltransferase complex ATPase subunit type 1 TsaE [Propionibacteriaceae bacterium]|nr:tRNA (adenosine(37)-N6)-threonylcarbamoyltransferase complex ATPase subunit type 1 TsaE [Propionibacteriaceae bacterium]